MKDFFRILGAILLSLSFCPVPAKAEVSTNAMLVGAVGTFNQRFLELKLSNGIRVRIPRAAVPEETEIRPKETIAVLVNSDQIQLAPK